MRHLIIFAFLCTITVPAFCLVPDDDYEDPNFVFEVFPQLTKIFTEGEFTAFLSESKYFTPSGKGLYYGHILDSQSDQFTSEDVTIAWKQNKKWYLFQIGTFQGYSDEKPNISREDIDGDGRKELIIRSKSQPGHGNVIEDWVSIFRFDTAVTQILRINVGLSGENYPESCSRTVRILKGKHQIAIGPAFVHKNAGLKKAERENCGVFVDLASGIYAFRNGKFKRIGRYTSK